MYGDSPGETSGEFRDALYIDKAHLTDQGIAVVRGNVSSICLYLFEE